MSISNMNILFQFQNPYLNRTEYFLELNLSEKKILMRNELREILSKQFNKPPELIIIRRIRYEYGGLRAYADVRVYEDKESLNIEPKHIILRHLSKEERSKIIEEMKKKRLEAKKAKEVSKK
jgi:ribosomal protein S24E